MGFQNSVAMASQALGILIVFGVGVGSNSSLTGAAAMGIFGVILVFFWAKFWFSRDIITATRSSLQINRALFGFTFSNSEYDNTDVKDLRYEEWAGGKAGTQNAIRFQYRGLTISFARQVGSADSWDLIDAIVKVYPFPMPPPELAPGVVRW
jgi:hypothetical protein